MVDADDIVHLFYEAANLKKKLSMYFRDKWMVDVRDIVHLFFGAGNLKKKLPIFPLRSAADA